MNKDARKKRAQLGGYAAAKRMTAKQRKLRAQKAANTRWAAKKAA